MEPNEGISVIVNQRPHSNINFVHLQKIGRGGGVPSCQSFVDFFLPKRCFRPTNFFRANFGGGGDPTPPPQNSAQFFFLPETSAQ